MRIFNFICLGICALLLISCADEPEGLEGAGVYVLIDGEEWRADDYNVTINRNEGFYRLVATNSTEDSLLEIEVEDTQIGDYDNQNARITYQSGSQVYRSDDSEIGINVARISNSEGITAGTFEGQLTSPGQDEMIELENGEYDGVTFVEID